MKITESKIREAQAVIEAVMVACDFDALELECYAHPEPYTMISGNEKLGGVRSNPSLADLYINRLHELAGTEPPPF